jgi:hypothetical protein
MDTLLQKLLNKLVQQCFSLLLKKGVFPYDFLDSTTKLQAPLKEISREDFNDWLNKGEGITDEEWVRFNEVSELFQMRTLEEYLTLYNELDVMQLADVFENFRNVTFNEVRLDPAHEYTLPGLSWSMANRMCMPSKFKAVEILEDVSMMWEDAKRGGVAMISHRYAVANNKYCPNYDSSKPSTWMFPLDANSLYPTAMYEPLPVGNFRWLDEEKRNKFRSKEYVCGLETHGPKGFLLKVNVPAVPERYHDFFNDYPLLPENRTVPIDDEHASPYNLNVAVMNDYDLPAASKSNLLVPHLEKKDGYVLHFRLLQYAIQKGIFDDVDDLDIIEVMELNQKAVLEPFVKHCAAKRKAAKTDFEMSLWKLFGVSLFGKTMENVRGRCEFHYFINHEGQKYLKKVSSERFKDVRALDDEGEMVCVDMRKYKIEYDKPLFLGVAILELSKLHMYKYHYDIMKPRYGDKMEMMFTDKDSLHYLIETENLYADLKVLKKLNPLTYDVSDAKPWHPLYDPNPERNNKKYPGAFKDTSVETGIQIGHVGLKAKLDADRFVDIRPEEERKRNPHFESEDKKTKGVKKSVVKNDLCFDDYVQSLQSGVIKKDVVQRLIRSPKHQLYSIEQKRIGLNPIYMKRWVCDNGVHTYAFGHYQIRNHAE